MNRILAAVFAVGLLAGLAGFMPMRAAAALGGLDKLGLSAASVSGSLWSGRLSQAAFRDVAFGDVDASVDFVSLVTGTSRVRLRAERGEATLVRSGGRVGMAKANLSLPMSLFPTAVPLPGTL